MFDKLREVPVPDRAGTARRALTSVEENNQLPKASNIKNVIPDEYENGFVTLIGVDLDEYSQKHGNNSDQKNSYNPRMVKHYCRGE